MIPLVKNSPEKAIAFSGLLIAIAFSVAAQVFLQHCLTESVPRPAARSGKAPPP